jgi:hypothetical protein
MSIRAVAYETPWNFWSWYWLILCGAWFVGFCAVEFPMIATGHGENTLSAQVWRLEGFLPGQSVIDWGAAHFLIGGALIVVFLWLIGHFVWGLWR